MGPYGVGGEEGGEEIAVEDGSSRDGGGEDRGRGKEEEDGGEGSAKDGGVWGGEREDVGVAGWGGREKWVVVRDGDVEGRFGRLSLSFLVNI